MIDDFPGFMREFGSRLLLGVLVVALVIVLIYQYFAGKTAQSAISHEALTSARELYSRARQSLDQTLSIQSMDFSPQIMALFQNEILNQESKREAFVLQARNVSRDALDALQPALSSSDGSVKAEAEMIRGDINMMLASIPSLPGATTRPELNGDKSTVELLKTAEDAYSTVLQPPLNENPDALRSARFSLAAISENRKDWDKARQFYQQIIDDHSTPAMFGEMAHKRQDNLVTLQKPILMGARTPAAPIQLGPMLPDMLMTQPVLTTQPTTTPTTTGPTTTATTQP